ncbi:CheR family methyltransferase [Aurantibacillus circumpalustris]|uniref:CheR family methyltransferase n=1 Tax=Aurantibacillus circumpalustris TaxID=3036359 RepID=UPI00295B6E07|nr:CheR family methyltransferase [Aurantibacillus circumpalustris]
MQVQQLINQYNKELSDKDFTKLSNFIFSNYGIKMPPAKKGMLQARLQSRLRATNIGSFKEYCDYIFSLNNTDPEVVQMIDVVSTNKTDFYRESAHFDFMLSTALPEFDKQYRRENLKVWSSACSSGEEVYTIAMVISEYLENNKNFDYSVLGTDISSRILAKASNAIYGEDRVEGIPLNIKRKYLLRSKNRENPSVRLIPEIRKRASYQRLNLMDEQYSSVPRDFDIVFCRNVLIYFDRPTQESVINKLCRHLKPGGYFFLGHSESITGIDVPLKQIKPTIFKKID